MEGEACGVKRALISPAVAKVDATQLEWIQFNWKYELMRVYLELKSVQIQARSRRSVNAQRTSQM